MNEIDEQVQREISRALTGAEGATLVEISSLTNVRTRNIDVEAIKQGYVINIKGVTKLIRQPFGNGFVFSTTVPYGKIVTDQETGKKKFVAEGVVTWYPTSLTKRRNCFEKDAATGGYKRSTVTPSMKASGTAQKAYASGQNMAESIAAVQAVSPYIELTRVTEFTTNEYNSNTSFVPASVGEWNLVMDVED